MADSLIFLWAWFSFLSIYSNYFFFFVFLDFDFWEDLDLDDFWGDFVSEDFDRPDAFDFIEPLPVDVPL